MGVEMQHVGVSAVGYFGAVVFDCDEFIELFEQGHVLAFAVDCEFDHFDEIFYFCHFFFEDVWFDEEVVDSSVDVAFEFVGVHEHVDLFFVECVAMRDEMSFEFGDDLFAVVHVPDIGVE